MLFDLNLHWQYQSERTYFEIIYILQSFFLGMWKGKSLIVLSGIYQPFMLMLVTTSRLIFLSYSLNTKSPKLRLSLSLRVCICKNRVFLFVVISQFSEGFMHTRMRRRVESMIQVKYQTRFVFKGFPYIQLENMCSFVLLPDG